jgi:hypothetical protein
LLLADSSAMKSRHVARKGRDRKGVCVMSVVRVVPVRLLGAC